MQFGRHPDGIKLYLDGHYVSFCEGFWRILQFHMHAEEPAVIRLQVHLPGMHMVTWNQVQNPNMHDVVARGEQQDSTLMGYFKANAEDAFARTVTYQDFPQHYVWQQGEHTWTWH
jgi:hypothetical protein